MLYDFFRFLRGVWEAVLLPFVILAIANLATDGWEAVIHLQDTLTVLFYFLCGCSHKNYPLSRSAIDAQRAALAAAAASRAASAQASAASAAVTESPRAASPTSASATRRRGYRAAVNSEDDNDADSEADFPSSVGAVSKRVTSDKDAVDREHSGHSVLDSADKTARTTLSSPTSSASPQELAPCIQRRLLLGKKGEVEEWLPALRGRVLVPPNYPLGASRSLHQLVSIVIGPIQQPTVATMPTRHPEPQWPPHFLRTSNVGSASAGNKGTSPNGVGGDAVGDPSTDDYSSSNSSATSNTLRHRSDHRAQAHGTPAAAATTARYRQASSVVYRRVSSRHLDFSNSRVAPHLIASITAHHVLSYPATRQKVLVMDLDETLCYVSTTTANMAGPPTFSEVIPTASGAELFHVWERPYARLFLSTVAKLFNVVLFTSASKPYADTILQRIDPDHLLKYRYYRQDCRLVSRGLLKKMCAVAGMRGVSPGSLAHHSSSDRSAVSSGGANPLGDFTTSAHGGGGGSSSSSSSGSNEGGCSTVNSDEESPGMGRDPAHRNAQVSQRRSTNNAVGSGGSSSSTGSNSNNNNSTWDDVPSSVAESVDAAADTPMRRDETRPSFPATARSFASARGLPTSFHTGLNANTSVSDSNSDIVSSTAEAVDDFSGLEKSVLNEHAKVLVKDLRALKVPPELLVMIDNSEECTLVNPENALIVSPYIPSLTKATPNEKSVSTVAAAAADPAPVLSGGEATAERQAADTTASADASASGAKSVSLSTGRQRSERGGRAAHVGADAAPAEEALLMGDDMTVNEGPEEDEVLLALLPMLECLLVVPDVRSILRLGKLY